MISRRIQANQNVEGGKANTHTHTHISWLTFFAITLLKRQEKEKKIVYIINSNTITASFVLLYLVLFMVIWNEKTENFDTK